MVDITAPSFISALHLGPDHRAAKLDYQTLALQAMADAVYITGGDVLEIGFGRGVSATMIQAHGVASHTIIECNHNNIKNAEAWREGHLGKDIRLIESLWEDAVGRFDEQQNSRDAQWHQEMVIVEVTGR